MTDNSKYIIWELANHVDLVVYTFANNESFCKKQLKLMEDKRIDESFLAKINASGYGNIAYMALHAHPKYREQFAKEYTEIMTLARNTVLRASA